MIEDILKEIDVNLTLDFELFFKEIINTEEKKKLACKLIEDFAVCMFENHNLRGGSYTNIESEFIETYYTLLDTIEDCINNKEDILESFCKLLDFLDLSNEFDDELSSPYYAIYEYKEVQKILDDYKIYEKYCNEELILWIINYIVSYYDRNTSK